MPQYVAMTAARAVPAGCWQNRTYVSTPEQNELMNHHTRPARRHLADGAAGSVPDGHLFRHHSLITIAEEVVAGSRSSTTLSAAAGLPNACC
jgi:hypothetical protein